MKGHIGSFLLGLGVAAAGAFVFDRYQSGDIDVGEMGDRMRELSHDVSRRAGEMKDQIQGKVHQMQSVANLGMVDLNQASREDLQGLGVTDSAMLDRLIENRPYRNKMDLLARMVVPQDIYDMIKDHIEVLGRDESVKVA